MHEYKIKYPTDANLNFWVCATSGCKVNIFVAWFTKPICPCCEKESHWKIRNLSYSFLSDELLEFDPTERRIQEI